MTLSCRGPDRTVRARRPGAVHGAGPFDGDEEALQQIIVALRALPGTANVPRPR